MAREILTVSIALLSVIRAICYVHQTQADPGPSLFDNKAFGIRTQVVSGKQRSQVAQVKVVEYYDPAQAISRIDYATGETAKEFYYTATSQVGLQTDSQSNRCQLFSKDDLRRAIMPAYANTDGMIGLFETIDKAIIPNRRYLVGPASVLYFLAKKSSSMVAIEVSKEEWQLKNMDIEGYSLEYYPGDGTKATIHTLYSAAEVAGKDIDTITQTVIPVYVYIEIMTEIITVMYYEHWLYPNTDYIRSGQSDFAAQSGQVAVDLFALPLYADCPLGDIKHSSEQDNFLAHLKTEAVQYSFTALIMKPNSNVTKLFVAFNGPSLEARLDGERLDLSSGDWEHSQTVVLDFHANRKYVITTPERSSTRCSATYIYPTTTDMMYMMRLKQFLFGVNQSTDQIFYMGRAKVRGQSVQVFKARVSQLPYWFGQPIVYINDKGKQELRQRGQRLYLNSNPIQAEAPSRYALIYVANNGKDHLAQVVQYELRESVADEDRLVFEAAIFNFVWRLSESPNGDSALDLFGHVESCSASSGGNHEQHNQVTVELSSTDPIENVNWFHSQVRRDQALAAELRKTLGIPSLMMYDFESSLTEDLGKARKFLVRFLVAEHPKIILNVRFWNRAYLLDDQPGERGETVRVHPSVQTFAECLWMVGSMGGETGANRLMRSSLVLFSENDKTCTVDTTSHASNRTNSKFYIRNDGEGELFQVEPTVDSALHLNQQLNKDLEQTVLTIRSYDDAMGQMDPWDVNVAIEKVQIKSFSPLPTTPKDDAEELVNPLIGYRFTEARGLSWQVRLEGNGSSQVNKEDADEIPLMLDESHCEAACLSDFNCMTYSYCRPDELNYARDTSANGECVLSRVDLGGIPAGELHKVREHIASYDQRIQLNTAQGQVRLERRGLCSVHRKRFIRMFLSKLPERRVMNQGTVVVQQVDSVEKCAEMCVAESAASVRDGKRITDEVSALIDKDKLSSSHKPTSEVAKRVEELRKEHKRVMKGFCAHYMFLDETMSKQQADVLRQIVAQNNGTDRDKGNQSASYCALEKFNARRDRRPRALQIIFDQYEFDFAKLYSQQHGIRLLRSNTTDEESTALVELQTRAMITQRQLNLLLDGIKKGKNYQIVTFEKTISGCAEACFRQLQGVWPSCRSFDVQLADRAWGDLSEKPVRCMLNTAHVGPSRPLADQKLVQAGANAIHFELIPDLVADAEVEEIFEQVHTIDRVQTIIEKISRATESGTAKFFIVLCGLATGVAVAIYGHRRFAHKRVPTVERKLLQSTSMQADL